MDITNILKTEADKIFDAVEAELVRLGHDPTKGHFLITREKMMIILAPTGLMPYLPTVRGASKRIAAIIKDSPRMRDHRHGTTRGWLFRGKESTDLIVKKPMVIREN